MGYPRFSYQLLCLEGFVLCFYTEMSLHVQRVPLFRATELSSPLEINIWLSCSSGAKKFRLAYVVVLLK